MANPGDHKPMGMADTIGGDETGGQAAIIQELRDAVSARDDFLAVAAHELRNPITPIRISVHLLRLAQETGDQARISSLLDRLDHQIERFISRMDVLLDIAQISSNQLRLERSEVDLSETVKRVIEEHQPMLVRAGSELTARIEDSIIGFLDAVAFTQIVENLISNAIKYGQCKPIEVTLTSARDQAELTVCDHGIGIGLEDRERIFQRFERAVQRKSHTGFGLGLWVSRRLTEAMGGSIGVIGQKGAGSLFTVTLPLKGTNR